jgi:glycosyltransferase involved in cell wall biosynthesis
MRVAPGDCEIPSTSRMKKSSSMKIAIIVHSFLPKWPNGTQIATYFMAEHLARRGHEVHVITTLDEGLPEESCEKGFYIHRIPLIKIRIFGALFHWRAIIRTIRKIEPDLVHAQSLISGMPALIAKKMLKIPYAIWGQGSDVYLPNGFIKLTSKTVIKNADSAIALTEDMKRVMQDIYDRDIAVVPNGIELGAIVKKPQLQVLEELEKRILFVGRLHPVKGVRYLIQAMQLVHEKRPEIKLILVGDGDERDYLENLTDHLGIRECVDFAGEIPHERIPDYMSHADVFVLSSLSESFGIVLLEAMAWGLPIVATRVGGIPEIIEDGVNGYLVNPGDYQEMADRIQLLLRDEISAAEMSKNNRQKAIGYSWEQVVMRLEDLYSGIV